MKAWSRRVDVDNGLQVSALLRKQADEIERALRKADQDPRIEPLGSDPVSRDAAELFHPEVRQIVDVHWTHCVELRGAATMLGNPHSP